MLILNLTRESRSVAGSLGRRGVRGRGPWGRGEASLEGTRSAVGALGQELEDTESWEHTATLQRWRHATSALPWNGPLRRAARGRLPCIPFLSLTRTRPSDLGPQRARGEGARREGEGLCSAHRQSPAETAGSRSLDKLDLFPFVRGNITVGGVWGPLN